MSDYTEKVDLTSYNISEQKRHEMLRLFPEIRTEGGQIDFERLKLVLGNMVDVGKERYGMNWHGKAECFKTIQAPSLATLLPCPEESINFDTTENLIVEGDNLEVLKLLQKAYLGKVKLIYIDPPYNTGNDFIYPDNYTESLQTYLEYTGQVDSEGRKFSTNSDTDGRFHSKWMNMIYPRLYLARNLLREDGAIFISIDDNEVDNLRKVCNEVFGEENFVANIVWQKKYAAANDAKGVSYMHDHILLYKRSDSFKRNLLPRTEKQDILYRYDSHDGKGLWRLDNLLVKSFSESYVFPIINPNTGKEYFPPKGSCWRGSKDTIEKWINENRILFGRDGQGSPQLKRYLNEVQKGIVPTTWWSFQECGHNDESHKELRSLFNEKAPFDTPKPTRLLKRMLQIATSSLGSDLILDFFAGSGTTAHAVLELNQQDSGNRKFILVQIPEPTGREDYPTIAEITKERVRRVIQKWNNAEAGQLPLNSAQDRGFRVFKLAESNFKIWNAQLAQDVPSLERQLELHIEHIREERTSEDILYEILLKSGYPLTTPLEKLTLTQRESETEERAFTVYRVDGGALLICLEKELTLELLRSLAEQKPERVVCLDAGFGGNDQLKANVVQLFKSKGIPSFKTV